MRHVEVTMRDDNVSFAGHILEDDGETIVLREDETGDDGEYRTLTLADIQHLVPIEDE